MRLKAGYFVKEPVPSYIFHGTKGSFLKPRADIQEAELVAGKKPGTPGWGTEPSTAWGLLHTEGNGKSRIPSLQGNYFDFYDGVYQALRNGQAMPVTADDGINVMKVIEAALLSQDTQEKIKFDV